jgi:hypothetical protein
LAVTSSGRWVIQTEENMSDTRILRIGQEAVSKLVIVVKCGKIFKFRFRLAMCLMRIAGRIGGFKSVKVIREK